MFSKLRTAKRQLPLIQINKCETLLLLLLLKSSPGNRPKKKTCQSNRVQSRVQLGLAVRQGRHTNKRHGFCSGLCRSDVAAFFSSPATKHPPSDPDGWKPLYFTQPTVSTAVEKCCFSLAPPQKTSRPAQTNDGGGFERAVFAPAEHRFKVAKKKPPARQGR